MTTAGRFWIAMREVPLARTGSPVSTGGDKLGFRREISCANFRELLSVPGTSL
jgi:hypothetical protein